MKCRFNVDVESMISMLQGEVLLISMKVVHISLPVSFSCPPWVKTQSSLFRFLAGLEFSDGAGLALSRSEMLPEELLESFAAAA